MTLKKLQIFYETKRNNQFGFILFLARLTALFNPNRLQFKHVADWNVTNISGQVANQERHLFEFKATRPVELTFDLFFDIDKVGEVASTWLLPGASNLWTDKLRTAYFLEQLKKLERLVQVDQELHRPPLCKLMWGEQLLLKGVLTSLTRRSTAFSSDGTPTRAEFTCTFTSVQSSPELHSSDVAKRRVCRQGDTLQSIAHEEYGQASLWRLIARENGISHPLRLVPGTQLLIPPLT